jgi:tungstate transport system substrate-binding protein
MNPRRSLLRLGAGVVSLALPMLGRAAQTRSLSDPLRWAADEALVDSGLAPLLQRSFGQETGVAVKLLRGPATAVLEALERGEHDAALTNTPEVEARLDKQGLVHDRHLVVVSDFVLVGPAALAKPLAAAGDVELALSRLAQAEVLFLTRPDGSGTNLAELAAWRIAKTAPGGAWYQQAPAGESLLAQAHARQACTIVERGAWAAQPVKGYAVLAGNDPRLAVDVHVMRTFRAERQHPAGKLFVAWLAGGKGRALAAAHRGYRAAKA